MLFLGLTLIPAGLLLRHSRVRARERFIESYAFPQRLRRKLAERYPHLSEQQTAHALRGLRQYFQLCRQAKRRMVAMPSQAVDVLWHEFILHTRQYQQFCNQGIGRFLHHVPSEAMQSPTLAQQGIRRAWRLACVAEGIAPKAPQRLPLLFALDAELAIADGFHYSLNCRGGKNRQGDTYCAGHIGCSSGCAGGCGGSSDGGGDSGGCGGGGD
ncbi:glycine-rich domain-containing protein [Pseudomonas sp.]|uniref:glycine-rich domain-containing protein n=1 Tax=Pseudomonas sp. TaxID=306 RepID=UPI0039C97341